MPQKPVPAGRTDDAAPSWVSPPLTESPDEHLVAGRWVDTQAVFNPQQGLIRYGDPFWVSQEQIDQDPRIIPWDTTFTADRELLAVALKEG